MTIMKTIYAEDVPYFKTSKTASSTRLERAKKEILDIGGKVTSEMFGTDVTGKAAFMLWFILDADQFKLTWPVLPCKRVMRPLRVFRLPLLSIMT